MPKKAARSTKKTVRRPRKKSFLEKLFTFPKLALLAFVVLSAFTVFQVSKPTSDVLGETSSASGSSYKLKLNMYSVKRTNDKSCLAKTYKIKVKDSKGKTTSYVITGNKDCTKFASPVIKLKGECNTISYESNLANWSLFEIKYSDSKEDPGYVYKSNKVQVCYYPPQDGEGLSVPVVLTTEFGMMSK